MKSRLYFSAPVWLQNLLVSSYGMLLRRRRYGGAHRATYAELQRSQWSSVNELKQLQLKQLNELIRAARESTPIHADRGLPSAPLPNLAALQDLPLLSKDDLRQPRTRITSRQYHSERPLVIHTGGTTGKPLAIYCNRLALQRNYAFFERFRSWAGISRGARVATFAGRTVVSPSQEAPPFWRWNAAARTVLFSSYHIGPETLPSYVEALTRFAPALIDSYPSSIEPIARYLLENGIESIRPTAIITSSETLRPAARRLIERAFRCRVFDHYGSAEMTAFITQCAEGRYHANPEYGIVEILHNGQPVAPGETGEIVATGFVNPVMPLIRYRMGDYAVRAIGSCPCGRAFPVFDRIEGRRDDVLVTPDGRLIGRLDPIFKAVDSIYETKIVQDATDHVRIEVVPFAEFGTADETTIVHELAKRLGPAMKIDLVRVNSIPRTPSGKFRAVVNELHPANSE